MSKKTEAKSNGSMLTVGFHSANPPLIWRFDLERNHSFTLSLQGEEGDWELGITTPKGDFYPVAHFDASEDAAEALAQVEKVLAAKNKPGSFVIRALAVLGVLAIVFFILVIAIQHKLITHARMATTSSAPSAPESGMPMSADDVLKPPH